jgi:hypothetical protein
LTQSSNSIAPAATRSDSSSLASQSLTGGAAFSTTTTTSSSSSSKITSVAVATSVSIAPLLATTDSAMSAVAAQAITASFATSTYTGQPILVGTCTIPAFTAISLADGSYLAAPLVGCDDRNPECCPSLASDATATPTASSSYIALTNVGASAVAALNAAPLTICPLDYFSTSSQCCPG